TEENVVAGELTGLGGAGDHRQRHRWQGGEQRRVGDQRALHHGATDVSPLAFAPSCSDGGFLAPLEGPPVVVPGSSMSFDVGDKVVYPHHSAAIIERREKRNVFGENREYLVLRLAYGDLTLIVPCDNTEEVGLREVINDEEVEEVFAVLRKKEARMPTNWSRRFKNHVEKLKSGD